MRGVFVYRASSGQTFRLHVRDCDNPATARRVLEDVLERPVRWEPER